MAIDFSKFNRVAANAYNEVKFGGPKSAIPGVEVRAVQQVSQLLRSGIVPPKPDPIPSADAKLESAIDTTAIVDASTQAPMQTDDSGALILPPAESSGLLLDGLVPDETQIAAVNAMAQSQYGCMIGAAGTGKTTTLRMFLQKIIYGDESNSVPAFKVKKLEGKQGLNIALVAFTGMAVQVVKSNMPEWLHPACKTIHGLLEFAPVTTTITDEQGQPKEKTVFMPMRTRSNKLQHKIIVIDEASMLGVELWHMLLDACEKDVQIFMIGDLNQLPPVGGASSFAHTMREWNVNELTHIHRQKEAGANRIVDVAHAILHGKKFTFDDPSKDIHWRVAGFELNADPVKAGTQIVSIANQLRNFRVHSSIDPAKPLVYDPYRDRLITTGNGYDENASMSSLQQATINEALSRLIEPPTETHPIYIIDAGRAHRRFAVNHRVMATKNEAPDELDRVTNGMVGIILDIQRNPNYTGDARVFGTESEVRQHRSNQMDIFLGKDTTSEVFGGLEDIANADFGSLSIVQKADKEGKAVASHSVTVKFVNGAIRTFSSKAAVESLMLAYASTCHKCQGSQFDTAIIVVHHVCKAMLSREWLYTAVTRATKRVVMLYTPFGIQNALAKQAIFGRTLEEKIERYYQQSQANAEWTGKRIRLYA